MITIRDIEQAIRETMVGSEIQYTSGWDITLRGTPKVHYYKGLKINILRVDESETSDIQHRYLITKEFVNERIINVS